MAEVGGCTLTPAQRIPVEDVVKTLRWLLSLSDSACVKEVVIECSQAVF